jgi:hypothetical protein
MHNIFKYWSNSSSNISTIETLYSEIHKSINCVLNKNELCDQWKESVIVLIYKKGDKINCSDYCGI